MVQRSNEWHLRDPEAVASVLNTDIYRGLEPSEVGKRRRREGKKQDLAYQEGVRYRVCT